MSSLEGRELQWVCDLATFNGWPLEAAEAAYEVFGARIFNGQGRSFRSLNRRIVHAVRVWEEKYGALSEAQEAYAGKVLAWAIRRGQAEAASRASAVYPYVLNLIAKAVNHEKVHAGFLRRAAEESGSAPIFDDLLRCVPR